MFGREPAVLIGGIAEIVRAIIPMMIIFGFLQWTDNQTAQVMLVIGVAVAVGEKMFTRSQVVPTETANAQIAVGIQSPKGTTVDQVIAKQERESQ